MIPLSRLGYLAPDAAAARPLWMVLRGRFDCARETLQIMPT